METQDGVINLDYYNNLITAITIPSKNMQVKYLYDNNNKVNKSETYQIDNDSLIEVTIYNWKDLYTIESTTYIYNDGNYQSVLKTVFKINDNNDPIVRSYYKLTQNGDWYLYNYCKYIWDLGNIVRIEYFKLKENDSSFYNEKTKLYEYDNKVNIWRNISIKEVNENEDIFIPSANNPVKITTTINLTVEKEISVYNYKYNSDNLPVSFTKTTTKPDGSIENFTVSNIQYICE
jgi:hypothetical protein